MANLIDSVDGYGARGIVLTEVRLRDAAGTDVLGCASGEILTLEIVARAEIDVKRPNLGYALLTLGGDMVYSAGVLNHDVMLADLKAGETCRAAFAIEMSLAPGSYGLTVLAADNEQAVSGDSGVHHDTRERIARIEVAPSNVSATFDGVAALRAAASHRFV